MAQGVFKKTAPPDVDPMHGCNTACPGCNHRMMSPEESLAQKEMWLKQQLWAWGDRFETIRAVKPGGRRNYRKRTCLSTVFDETGWRFGLKSQKKVIPIHDCPVHTKQVRQAVSLFSGNLPAGPVFPMIYYVQTGAQVTLVLKTDKMPRMSWLDDNFKNRLQQIEIEGVWLHLHPCAGRRVFAKNGWHLIYGKARSVDNNGLRYGPRTFQQLIPSLYGEALDSAEAFLAPGPEDIIIELYCGIGAGLARWTRRNSPALGVELEGEAIACAVQNAPAATVLRGRCGDRIPQMSEWIRKKTPAKGLRLLYVNPPRTGLEDGVLKWIADRYRPDRMVYMSCSAGTLRRDLGLLAAAGYKIIRIIPYDFFPQTKHVESLVFLNKSRQHITRPVSA